MRTDPFASRQKLLVVDDNPTSVFLLARALEKQGYAVLTASRGDDAIEAAIRERPELILLDVMMPDLDGFNVCRILKEKPETSGIPIIFVTARMEVDEVVEALSIGGADYIAKPFNINEVLARVKAHLRLRQFEKELIARNGELERLSEQLGEMNLELARLTRVDPLTGLLNRRAWYESMVLEQERCCRQDSPYGMLMIDIDHFKAFNDTAGHQAGDECLRRVADRLRACCSALDCVGRYGGEEFILLCSGSDESGAAALAERIRQAVWELQIPHRASPTAPWLTVSIGVASGQPADPCEAIVKRADEALYTAKQAGRNCVRCFVAAGAPWI